MAVRVGGQSPDAYGLSLTVKVPTASATNKVNSNQPLVWAAGAYNASIAPDGSIFNMVAKHPVEDATTPLGVWLANTGASRIHVFSFTGAPPTVGGSVVSNGTGGVRAAAGTETGLNNRVLYVDTVRSYVEVLI